MNPSCAADGCDSVPAYRAGGGLCPKHWHRWRRYGTTQPVPRPKQVKPPCSVADCDAVSSVRGWCPKHYGRWTRTGDPLRLTTRHNWSGERVTYRALHKRLERVRGKASEHACVDCGHSAGQWSYEGGDPEERMSEHGFAYTPNLDAYRARCVSCHKRRDDPMPVGLRHRWPRHEPSA